MDGSGSQEEDAIKSAKKGTKYLCLQTPAWLPAWPIVRVVATAVDVSWPKFSNKPQDAADCCAPDDDGLT